MTKLIGQEEAKRLLNAVATRRSNVLFVGGPGMGKTTFARWYLDKFAKKHLELTGQKELPLNLLANQTIFIDEAHKLDNPEALYGYLADEGSESKSLFRSIKREKTIFVLATTDQGMLPKALITRLSKVAMRPYTFDEIVEIVVAHHGQWIVDSVARNVAYFAYGNPRRAVKLGELMSDGLASGLLADTVGEFFALLGYQEGLDAQEREMLAALVDKPRSITTLSGMLGVGRSTVNEVEIGLISGGLVQITSKGRSLTDKGYELVRRL